MILILTRHLLSSQTIFMVIANCRKPSRKQDRKKKIAWQDQFEGAFHLTDIEVVEARFAWKVGQIILTNGVKFISIVAKLYFNIKKAIFAKHFNFNATVAKYFNFNAIVATCLQKNSVESIVLKVAQKACRIFSLTKRSIPYYLNNLPLKGKSNQMVTLNRNHQKPISVRLGYTKAFIVWKL